MTKYYDEKVGNTDWRSNIYVMEVSADDVDFVDNWYRIRKTLDRLDFRNGVLIVDNIYTSTEYEIQINEECKKLVREFNSVRKQYNLSMILIAHCNKGTSEQKRLDKDQIQGGAVLCSNIANVTMIGNSTLANDLNIMKIVKAGRSSDNDLLNIAFKMHWNNETLTFTKGSIIKNEALHFQPMSDCWEIKTLRNVADELSVSDIKIFDRDKFKDNVPKEVNALSDTKVTRALGTLINWGLVKRLQRNNYQLLAHNLEDFDPKSK